MKSLADFRQNNTTTSRQENSVLVSPKTQSFLKPKKSIKFDHRKMDSKRDSTNTATKEERFETGEAMDISNS